MIDAAAISEILKVYDKYGWRLRRVLLTRSLKSTVNAEPLFDDADLVDSDINAAWFSRAARPGSETWEIRHLSETPFALLEVIDAEAGDPERDAILAEVEDRLREKAASKSSGSNIA